MMTIQTSVTFFRRRLLQTKLAVSLCATLFPGMVAGLTPDFPEINLIRGRTAAGYPYLNGGISFTEQRVIERAAHHYNLKIIFARRTGTPITPAFVMIGANKGREVEKIALGAPWFLIRLPPGGYTILARFKTQVVVARDVLIGEGRRRTYVLRGD
ncbi:MAG: hypothetical protein ACM3SP_19070 [Chloroflexota bacterium]